MRSEWELRKGRAQRSINIERVPLGSSAVRRGEVSTPTASITALISTIMKMGITIDTAVRLSTGVPIRNMEMSYANSNSCNNKG